MAKKLVTKVPVPVAVTFEREPYQKRSSYSPEQSDNETYFFERTPIERNSKLSPGPPEKSWGNGSYEPSGRAVRVGQGGPGNQSSPAGEHTRGRPGKPMRPGRW
jgi:hypothetical protein